MSEIVNVYANKCPECGAGMFEGCEGAGDKPGAIHKVRLLLVISHELLRPSSGEA